MEFKGSWNAETNTPVLTDGTGTNGDFYICSVAGTWNSIVFAVNDRIIYDGSQSKWIRLAAGDTSGLIDDTKTSSIQTYSSEKIESELGTKANVDDVYSKTETLSKTEIETNYYNKQSVDSSFVPKTRTVNGKALSSNITLGQNDIKLSSTKNLKTHSSTTETTYTIESLDGYSYISLECYYGSSIYVSGAVPIYVLKTIKQFVLNDEVGSLGVKYNSNTSVTLWSSYNGRNVILRAYK